MRILLVFVILLSTGCTSTKENTYKQFVGMSIAETIKELQINIDQKGYFILTEPPAVPRGLYGTLPSGEEIRLFIKRGQLPLTFEGADKLENYNIIRVVGIKIGNRENGVCYGEVYWHHSCDGS